MQWTFQDRAGWPSGPWDSEPDKMQWRDEATGLACLIHRGPLGGLCGYVGMPPRHPLFGKDYNDVNADANGGLTFSDKCQEQRGDGSGICHVAPGEPELWWLGFDCAHSWDICPGYPRGHRDDRATYKTVAYVKNQCRKLAQQLAAV